MIHYHITEISNFDGELGRDHVGQHDHLTLDEAIARAADCVRATTPEFGMDVYVGACAGQCTYETPFQCDELEGQLTP